MLSALEITGDYNDRKEPFSNSLDRWSAGLKKMDSRKRASGKRREFCSLASSLYLVARLTKVQELRLSFLFDHVVANYRHTDTITHRQYDCLSMKPESGLGLIEDIRELRIVGLDNMKVGIDSVAEEWAAENCPNMVIRHTDHNLDQGSSEYLDTTEYTYGYDD
ncbi:hypothetical protein BKA57DRAFT_433050 [Linnemannia elongata]|nr:hypothetical protein BKA57DRAFT_433050 [Linnemannia elongata]